MTPRFRSLFAALLILSPGLAACGDDGATEPQFEVIEDTEYAASLGVDLSRMTQQGGVYVWDSVVGAGDLATPDDSVTVNYALWLTDGQEIGSGQWGFWIGFAQAIAGFEVGVTGMREGGHRQVLVPPIMGYGSAGNGAVPPGAVLVFRIELLDVFELVP